MASIERQLTGQFSTAARSRGDELLDHVAFVPGWNGDFPCDAIVRDGDSSHEVRVDPDEPAVGWCSCGDFLVSGPCAHMWATVRATELVTSRPELLGLLDEQPESDAESEASCARELDRRLDDLSALARRGPVMGVAPLAAAVRQVHCLLVPPPRSDRQGSANVESDTCSIVPVVRTRRPDGSWGAPERIAHWRPDAGVASERGRPLDDALTPAALRWLGVLEQHLDNRFDDFPCAELPHSEASRLALELAHEHRLFTASKRNPRGANERSHEFTPVHVRTDEGRDVWVELELRDVSDRAIALELSLSWLGRREPQDLDSPPDLDAATPEAPRLEAADVRAVVGDHFVLQDELVRWSSAASRPLVVELVRHGPLIVDRSRIDDVRGLVQDATVHPAPSLAPRSNLRVDPKLLAIDPTNPTTRDPKVVQAELEFCYRKDEASEDVGRIAAASRDASVRIGSTRHRRAPAAEHAAIEAFLAAGGGVLEDSSGGADGRAAATAGLGLPVSDAADRIRALLVAGFEVSAGAEPIRLAPPPTIRVASGIDWFELEATLEGRDGEAVVVPELLRPSTEGKRPSRHQLVRLESGDLVLVDSGTQDLETLRTIGQSRGDTLQIPRAQAFVLDGILRERLGEVELDQTFRTIREQATRGLEPAPLDAPSGFRASLRPYQRDALGWFAFLRSLGVGGCLADDMGLGKTVQVLALLEQERERDDVSGPSLVVAPRSLLFHWEREAHKFAPALRVAAFAGAQRKARLGTALDDEFKDYDLILTTYGTLRNDIEQLADIEWNYVILDEAHAIKNDSSQASRAVRACRARHRLALSGTPVENHLGELWALFEFLNPGMLGASRVFRRLVRDASERSPTLATKDAEADDSNAAAADNFAASLRVAVRPFLLRRTKEQVLDELPPKTIQILDCELAPSQRVAYDELAAHYRARLLGKIDEGSIPDALRFQVLEALLRLRQAACHPALIDATRADENCGKFEVLWPMLEDLRQQGHKALLFSQFPSFLTLLRSRLDERGLQHAYLDGATRDRRAQVDRFEQDPECGLFLISIKAGGHGLNLTSASYVFLLDPWWNPAVEAQAIDRAHRMGQTKKVHAYRLLCRDTVEERVAELQERKRKIAAAVLGDDRSVLQELRAADVALLLT